MKEQKICELDMKRSITSPNTVVSSINSVHSLNIQDIGVFSTQHQESWKVFAPMAILCLALSMRCQLTMHLLARLFDSAKD